MTLTSASHLVALGDLVLDVVVVGERRVARGSDVPGTISFRAGGSAANVARSFSRLGGRATFIGAVGHDRWGRALIRSLRADGVRTRVVLVDAPTARLADLVEPGGERSFVTQRGAADQLSANDVDPRWLRVVDGLHLPAYSLLAEPLAGAARRAATLVHDWGGLVSVDLASRAPLLAIGRRRARAAVASVRPDLVFATVAEASALYRPDDPERLLELAPLVVIKEGDAGCRIVARGAAGTTTSSIPTEPIAATDTTGAGDAFAGGFMQVVLDARRRGGSPTWPPGGGTLGLAATAGHRSARDLLTADRAEIDAPARLGAA